jgi:hypothetical protein
MTERVAVSVAVNLAGNGDWASSDWKNAQVVTGAPPGTRTPNPRIKSPMWTVRARNPKQGKQNVRTTPATSGPVRAHPCWSELRNRHS